jgi:hypothetical protein
VAKTNQAKSTGKPAKPASKAGNPAKKQVKKERGTVLSILLGLILLHAIFATFLAFTSLRDQYAGYRNWILVLFALISLADILAAVGMWYWKKWAIYLYAGTRVIATAVHLMLTGSGLVVFYDLLPVAILGYVINLQSKQNLFE